MKNIPLGIAGLALAVSGLFGFTPVARGQDGGPPAPIVSRALSASVDYGNDAVYQPAKTAPDFEQLGLDPWQTVTITVQFPAELAGQTLIAEPLDGGALTLPEGGLVVGADGSVTFQFQAGDMVGTCRLAIHQPDDMNVLHFWIVDQQNPANNPTPLPGAY